MSHPRATPTRRLPQHVLREFVAAELRTLCPGEDVLTEYRFHPVRQWRFDLAVPTLRIAVEWQGFWAGGHGGAVGFYADCAKFCAAAAEGWLLFPVPYRMARDDMTGLRTLLRQAVERRRAGDGPGRRTQ